nr:site-specific integrase [Brevibacillus laterosporus]
MKYLDNIGKAENTLKSYCYHLKLYFQFLEEYGLSYQEVNLDILARFIGWLRIPDQSSKIIYFEETLAKRSEKTVNTIITYVIGFYDYMARNEDYGKNISDQLKKQVPGRFKTFKPFLHHITKDNSFDKNILKIKEPRRTVKTLSKNQLQVIRNACSNIRALFDFLCNMTMPLKDSRMSFLFCNRAI